MVRVDKTKINDILIGGKPASAMLNEHGGILWEKSDDSILVAATRTSSITREIEVPHWCNYIEYILIGAGGGGESGSGSDGQNGRPADAGEISLGTYAIPYDIDRSTYPLRIQVLAGKPGAGGTSGSGSGRHGGLGGHSMLNILQENAVDPYGTLLFTHRVDGGLGGPASNRPRGGQSGGTPEVYGPRYLYRAADDGVPKNWQPESHRYGVGGGGGEGGIFNRYTYGGVGGPGAALIAFGGAPAPQEKVTITLGEDYEARDQFRAALTARGLNHQTVTEVPFVIELVGTGSLRDMFRGCSSLILAPHMNTRGVTSMRSMFYECSSLAHVPKMNTSQVTQMQFMFHACSALTMIPDLETYSVTIFDYMFQRCSALADGNVRLIGRHAEASTAGMIVLSGLTRMPFYSGLGTPI